MRSHERIARFAEIKGWFGEDGLQVAHHHFCIHGFIPSDEKIVAAVNAASAVVHGPEERRMTPQEFKEKPAIDHLRLIVQNFDSLNETFNQRFSFDQIIAIHKAWMLSEWDKNADTWTARQVREALRGIPPHWDDDEKPVYRTKSEADLRCAGFIPASESREEAGQAWAPLPGERVQYAPIEKENCIIDPECLGTVTRVLVVAYVDWDGGYRGQHEVTVLKEPPPEPEGGK